MNPVVDVSSGCMYFSNFYDPLVAIRAYEWLTCARAGRRDTFIHHGQHQIVKGLLVLKDWPAFKGETNVVCNSDEAGRQIGGHHCSFSKNCPGAAKWVNDWNCARYVIQTHGAFPNAKLIEHASSCGFPQWHLEVVLATVTSSRETHATRVDGDVDFIVIYVDDYVSHIRLVDFVLPVSIVAQCFCRELFNESGVNQLRFARRD
mmetsp:Transcript_3518/g.6079  ORF Transcript_3518/g.6079 Transcript_3518/m.6079 type:complete len:204 (+) Transcript_3518:430-1041(+)